MNTEIEAYALAWSREKGYRVRIKLKGQAKLEIIEASPAEFCALAAILRESPVFFSNGWIHTGDEPTGN